MVKVSNQKVIRDKGFARRLSIACDNHPECPSGHGQQIWLLTTLKERFNISVSREAVRKWFHGESRPRPKIMKHVAIALAVDEAWLSLDIGPVGTPREKEKINAIADGAVNLVSSLIQLSGGTVAFAEVGDNHDIFTIIRGRKFSLSVRIGQPDHDNLVFSFPIGDAMKIAVIPTRLPTVFKFLLIPNDLFEANGINKGTFSDVVLSQPKPGKFAIGDVVLPEINNFGDLDGKLSASKSLVGISDGTEASNKRKAI